MILLQLILLCTLFCIQIFGNTESNDSNEKIIRWPYNPRQFRSCFPEIGCINTNEDWYHKVYRPVNLEPLDRHTIRTEFLLLKGFNGSMHEILYDQLTLKEETIKNSGYETNSEVIFLIHDFSSNGETGWIKHITCPLLGKNSYNVIAVDWEGGAEPPFPQAIANARVVALEIIALIKVLQEKFSLTPDKIHIIGHGVGAHIAGYVGKIVKGLKKITALDPTGPSFAHMPCKVKLTRRDAQYVEVLHTDAFNDRSQGTLEGMGHADFYVNKAEKQPGCEESTELPPLMDISRNALKEGKILPGCSHKRAFKYYIESAESSACTFIGVKCDSIEDMKKGNCEKNMNTTDYHNFGLDAEIPSDISKRNRYILQTSCDTPFCLHAYRVEIKIDETSPHEVGCFELIVIDENNIFINMSSLSTSSSTVSFLPGNTYGQVFYASSPKVTKVKEAKLKWSEKCGGTSMLNLSPKIIKVKKFTIAPADSPDEKSELCPLEGIEIKDNSFLGYKFCGESDDTSNATKKVLERSATFTTAKIESAMISPSVKDITLTKDNSHKKIETTTGSNSLRNTRSIASDASATSTNNIIQTSESSSSQTTKVETDSSRASFETSEIILVKRNTSKVYETTTETTTTKTISSSTKGTSVSTSGSTNSSNTTTSGMEITTTLGTTTKSSCGNQTLTTNSTASTDLDSECLKRSITNKT